MRANKGVSYSSSEIPYRSSLQAILTAVQVARFANTPAHPTEILEQENRMSVLPGHSLVPTKVAESPFPPRAELFEGARVFR
ncbi:hypothetical protein M407DRAFT_241699 [Tulasnella calospora MUT 4182]|uniref:Uncharacterized protein n=1 Tax=Tulasnella calospora MUT 4182 TaxID=1051891 RepID=A0A0C3MDH6_9AGAM|nr:hypothetical protein M407DRAFT_241699 [Tulasnella calospora MUT 4182]